MDKVYLGIYEDEEAYVSLDKEDLEGWSLIGLRPNTERELRDQARDCEPGEMLGLTEEEFQRVDRWFDQEKFAEDMEEDWLERHDSAGEYTVDGETIYLGHGSGQGVLSTYEKENINTYEDWEIVF